MAETRRKFDQDFKEGAVRLVRETGRLIAETARDLGVNAGDLGNWVNADGRRGDGTGALNEDERAELARLRKENAEMVPVQPHCLVAFCQRHLVPHTVLADVPHPVLPPSLFEHPAAELSVDDSAQLCEDRRQPGHIA